jgi:ectoine hydroxylase-related dioxygenase (phytanoyl-CoA dioxygenase family)
MGNLDCDAGDWLTSALERLRDLGYAVVEGVLDEERLERGAQGLYDVQRAIHEELGPYRLTQAGELGVLRIMARFDPWFLTLLETPEMLAVVDATVSETAILHLQNGFILPPAGDSEAGGATFQQTFHRDFPRHLHGYVASVNALLTFEEFTAENGGTLVVSGSHQRPDAPDQDYMREAAVGLECPAGSMVLFDSTLWHAAGVNRSERDRLAINHQFTRSWIKQQIDYVRALGDDLVLKQPSRTQQLLGWYTRVVTSLDEYYRPAEERLYRGGQG